MNIDTPLKELGAIEIEALQNAILALNDEDWLSNEQRQNDYEVHKQTQSVILVFCDGPMHDLVVSKENGWDQKIDPNEDAKSKRKINEQIWAALVCFLLTGITLFFLIRTKGRVMKVDDEGYYPPGGALIPFGDITKLDKRKWEMGLWKRQVR